MRARNVGFLFCLAAVLAASGCYDESFPAAVGGTGPFLVNLSVSPSHVEPGVELTLRFTVTRGGSPTKDIAPKATYAMVDGSMAGELPLADTRTDEWVAKHKFAKGDWKVTFSFTADGGVDYEKVFPLAVGGDGH